MNRRSSPKDPTPARWEALRRRARDDSFFYAVRTTGIYCRCGCPSRLPLRENVSFHESALAAELAGFRPCRRCRPRMRVPREVVELVRPVVAMCRLLEESAETPRLRRLAEHVGWSESHAQRSFTRVLGLSPRAYRDAVLRSRAAEQLRGGRGTGAALHAAGFGSSSRFYERIPEMLGMSVKQYRGGAAELVIRFAVGECSLGAILVAATERGICAVFLGDEPEPLLRDLERRFPRAQLVGGDADFERLVARVTSQIEAGEQGTAEALPLDVRGTAFQERVWRALAAIPRGRTATYLHVARAIGAPTSSRAVARACADNRVAVLIPCHRVVRGDGSPSGYRWGVERKHELLRRERGEDERGEISPARPGRAARPSARR